MAHTQAELETSIVKLDKYIANLRGKKRLTAAQSETLAVYIDRVRGFRAELAELLSEPPPAPPSPVIDLGPDPYPNNALPPDPHQLYDCPDDVAAREKTAGAPIQTILNRVATAALRPAGKTAADAYVQAVVKDYFDGKAPFELSLASHLGGTWGRYLGCVTVAEIHDLGA